MFQGLATLDETPGLLGANQRPLREVQALLSCIETLAELDDLLL